MEMECAICLEPIDDEGTTLPCQCKLHYCLSCWDKALANSYCQRGQATCPSCRTLVRVDFDAEKQSLMFTAETVDMTFAAQRELVVKYHQEMESRRTGATCDESVLSSLENDLQNMINMRQDMITRLRHQAQPVQIKLLQGYGKANPSLAEIQSNATGVLSTASEDELRVFMTAACIEEDESSEKSDLICRLEANQSTIGLCSLWASYKCQSPKCICGCAFQRINGIERYRNCMGEQGNSVSEEDIERRIRHLQMQNQSAVICDLCEDNIPLARESFVWTCENKNSSILHATSYDICDKCFVEALATDTQIHEETCTV